MASSSIFFLTVFSIGFCSGWMVERPALETQDGNLVISSGKDRNITLLTFGKSTVNINDINLVDVSIRAQEASQIVEKWENGYLRQMTSDVNRILATIEGPYGLQKRLSILEIGGDGNSTSSRNSRVYDPIYSAHLRNLTRRVRSVERSLILLKRDLRRSDCDSSPCGNGGTCIKIYKGFQCICPSNWEGPTCSDDVNECTNFAGTDLGCQNGASCVNLPGSYRCNCVNGWHGIHCRTKSNACDAQDSRELCGFGVCVPKAGTPLGYICICDEGWKSSGVDPACTTDVDECSGKHPACSMNPYVSCLNVPGSFHCGTCPPGYTGNGHYCTDIDECAVDNGGCSTTPRVQCINTIGSFNCGPCPAGYQGNGQACTYVGLCGVNNGGCHPLATCIENPAYSNIYPQCKCPAGYQGFGIGPQGCLPGSDTRSPCTNNLCVHGTCQPNGIHYTCQCNPRFTGVHCETAINPCQPNPCENQGTCNATSSGTVTCECTSKFTGPRCETPRESCGGLFKNPSGVLEYPTTGEHYEHDLNCAFVIITNITKVLRIRFTKFGFEKSQSCRYDFLQIHDGANAGAHQIGRFCGSDFPLGGNFVTTHNAVYFWLRTDSSRSNLGFALRWETVEPTCGGYLTEEHGIIHSPGSPGKYPNNRDCVWEVSVRPGKRIQFHFFTVMMEEHATCEADYLEINETSSDRNIQLGLYCNHSHPAPLTTSGSFATVHFHSDQAGTDMGFQISYSTIEGVPGCGGVFTTPTGIITSPGFPGKYPARMLCDWKIQLPKNEKFRLNWITFNLEAHRMCRFDYVQVLSGPDLTSSVVGKYCGSAMPPSVVIESNEALIIFRSDWSNEYDGFQLEYQTICGGQFYEPSGTIQSPYYPAPYPSSRTCTYEIIQPPGKGIVLTIVAMDIEGGLSDNCYFDTLFIYDGDNENSTQLGSLCGSADRIPAEPFFSTQNFMFLKFQTDSSINNHGFLANYTTVDRKCGGLLKTPGIISSNTNGENEYSNNEECVWTIKAPNGHVVEVTFTAFSLELGFQCTADYVQIYDGTKESGQEIGRFCGSTKPQPLVSQSEIMTFIFRTDSSITNEGFIAHYIFMDSSKVCGGHYYQRSGYINSPNYPDKYPSNRECVWVITASNKHQIYLMVSKFELEDGINCAHDYLEIRNGGYANSPLIGKYCGTQIPEAVKSLTNEMYIKLVTDSTRHFGGFNFEWEIVNSGCGGTLSSSKGEIISPGYPQPYSRLAVCTWKIMVSEGSKVRLIFVDFDLEEHAHCRYDYVQITTGNEDNRRSAERYCGTNVPALIEVESNVVNVYFKSDYTNAGRGFHLRYETVCERRLRGFGGTIASPNFPDNYPPNSNCSWIIEAPSGNTVNLTFSHFDLETPDSSDKCTNDYLWVREGQIDEADTELGLFCGSNVPSVPIASNQHEVFLRFVTDSFDNNAGFRLEWMTVGCGGHLTRPFGQLMSPGYPNGYKQDVDCEWLIELEHGQSVEIEFHDLSTEKTAGCRYDKVSLYAGSDDLAPKITEVCHSDKPIKFTSPGNKLFVRFHGDFSYSGRGFNASYKGVDAVCGGVFRGLEGFIYSANYPLNYGNNQNCEWLIEVDRNHVVNLTFFDFDIEDTTNCTDDYVKVFDGPSRNNDTLGTFCRNVLPNPIVSSGNSMLVVMRSDSILTAKGFKAQFQKACGARIVTDHDGTLDATSLLHMEDSLNCTWTIIAKDPADHITFTFFHMGINGYSWDDECDRHYVRLYEGESVDGPIIGTWCGTKTPPPITSTGNAITAHLMSYDGSSDERFGATYSVLNTACGGEYQTISGSIASPMYPNSYPENAECIWLLKSSPGNRISLTFSTFGIETSSNCDRDYLEIREESAIGKLIGTYCDDSPSDVIAANKLWIKFRSDETGTGAGFLAEFSLLHGNELSGTGGEIASPLYPLPWKEDNYYESIEWRITVDFGMAIKIEFDVVHIENYDTYCTYKISVYDGYNEDASELASVCGYTPPSEPILSSSNVVYLTFSSSFTRVGSWFHLNWYQIPRQAALTDKTEEVSDCVVEYDLASHENTSVTFNSSGWPEGYAPDLDCSWIITAPVGHHLGLRFLDMSLETSRRCIHDSVTVYDGRALKPNRENVPVLGTFCHQNDTSLVTYGKSVMTVNFRSDFYENGTGFRATVVRICGGELTGPNGMIDFNETVHMYNGAIYGSKCEWNITVRQGKTISIKFPLFHLPVSEGTMCKDNYILLRNGAGPDSPLLGSGKYCDTVMPPDSLETTGNKLYVKTVGLRSQVLFKLEYEEVGMGCGGSYNIGSPGEIQLQFNSPNYPNIPPPYTECVWTFRSTNGDGLSLHFVERFDLTSSPDCEKEYVEVRDGATEHSKFLGRYCGETAPSSITTQGDMLYVRFYTESPEPKNGFKAAVTSGDVCGGIIRGVSGIIKSPNYPGTYPNSKSCDWWIIAPPDHTLKLEFRDLNLPNLRRCENSDYVTIADKVPINDTVNSIGQWCGSTKPGIIETPWNEAVVSFRSDDRPSGNYRGFSLNYNASKESCGGSLSGTSGVFKSAGYPNMNTRSRFCEWEIIVPEGSQVVVEILDLDTTRLDSRQSFEFYLAFYNDKTLLSRILSVRKSPYPTKIYSTSNYMMVTYWSGVGRLGLRAQYTAAAPAPCGGEVQEMSGSLSIPPAPYNQSAFYCPWKLRVPENMVDARNHTTATLTVTISGLITTGGRPGRSCMYRTSYIKISDGQETIGAACGNMSNTNYTVRSPAFVNMIDVLNSTYGLGGNQMNFNLHYEWKPCGGMLSGPSHTIRAPENVAYPKSCVWHVKYEDPGAAISLVFNRMNMGSCDSSYIIVRNGGPLSPQVGKFCGNIKPHNITSSSNQLWIEFWADHSPADFELKLDSVSGSCGGSMRGSSKEFRSPGFPKQYPNNAECTWEVSAMPGHNIGLYFVDRFNLETSNQCENDFVQIFDWQWDNDGIGNWHPGPKYCGRNLPTTFNATSHRLKVLFRSNTLIQGDGFRAMWDENCGGVFEARGREQWIESPHYPDVYDRNQVCNYTIIAPRDKQIHVVFDDFELEGRAGNCKFDNLTITRSLYHGISTESVVCGTNKPLNIYSYGSITLIFKTDAYVQKRGFRFKYFVNECGGEITEPMLLTPPLSGDGVLYGRLNCTWLITAPEGKSVSLRFEKFSIRMSHHCVLDHIQIFDGLEITLNASLAVLCGNLTDLFPIKSNSNKMVVMFRSEFGNAVGSFLAAVTFVNNEASGCGGKISLTETRTFRTQKGSHYESLEDCYWRVISTVGNNIRLRILKMDLKNSPNVTRTNSKDNCTGDFLEVRDGYGPLSELVGKYCGSSIPQEIMSTSNVLWIRLSTDDAYEGEGVIGSLEPVPNPCGKNSFVINKTQVIESPSYPLDFPAGLVCKWSFQAMNQSRKLRLLFDDLNLEDAERCGDNYIEISTAPSPYITEGFGAELVFNGKANRRGTFKYGEYNEAVTYKYCGQGKAIEYHSTGDEIHVKLKSSSESASVPRKFKFEVSLASCSQNYTAEQGRLVYQDSPECWTTIETDPNRTISLFFKRFAFYDGNNCEKRFVQIHDGDFNSPVNSTLCGYLFPQPFFSTGNKISIRAKSSSDSSYHTGGYDIIYTTTDQGRGCGGKIFNYAGLFTSPMFPENYRKDGECVWEISVPRAHRVSLNFDLFDLGSSETCNSNYIIIAEEFVESPRSETYCPGNTPARFTASGHTVKVIYVSSVNNAGSGWKISFTAERDGYGDYDDMASYFRHPPRIRID